MSFALVGNGKIFQSRFKEVEHHATTLARELTQERFKDTIIAYAPPVPFLGLVSEVFARFSNAAVTLASQSISWKRHGMDTGGIPGNSLKDLGARIAIVNHSEQKAYLRHSPEYHKFVSLQITNALDCGLTVLLCCGEDKGDEGGGLEQLYGDIYEPLQCLNLASLPAERLMIAYEPGGVIGTGKTAPIHQIKRGFEEIRGLLQKLGLGGIRLLYGGGVNQANLAELHHGLAAETDFFGYLVGEASTRADEFIEMAQTLEKSVPVQGTTPAHTNLVAKERTNGVTRDLSTVGAIEARGKTRVAIVGLGEIGAATAIASALDSQQSIEVVQIFNQHLSPEDVHGRIIYSRFVDMKDASYWKEGNQGYIRILNQVSKITPHDSMEDAARQLDDIDVVVFTAVEEKTKDPAFFKPFLGPGRAKAVVVTCATPAADFSLVAGFNHHLVNVRQHKIVALGSCTGNCAVPILSVIEECLGEGAIRGLYAVAPHSKTNSQEVGNKGMDPKREGLLSNLIPTTTGLSKLLQEPGFFETLGSESIEAVSIRTPTEDVSLLCMEVDVECANNITTADIRSAFRRASQSARWNGIIACDQARGTKVFWKDTHACVVFEPFVQMRPIYLKNGQRAGVSKLSVMAAYANVSGYSWQVVRAVKALNLGRVSKEAQVDCDDSLQLVR